MELNYSQFILLKIQKTPTMGVRKQTYIRTSYVKFLKMSNKKRQFFKKFAKKN